MAVLPGHRGRGIGTALLGRALEAAGARGEAVSLSVARTNPARRLYERAGFVGVGEVAGSLTMRRAPRPGADATAAVCRLRLMLAWGGGALWAGDAAACDRLDVGPCEDRLPLSGATRARLEALSAWHGTALNRAYPPDPGPWSEEEQARFDAAADEVLRTIRRELGPEYEVVYVRV
jgi:hypothetical protein